MFRMAAADPNGTLEPFHPAVPLGCAIELEAIPEIISKI